MIFNFWTNFFYIKIINFINKKNNMRISNIYCCTTKNSLLFLSRILIFKFFVFSFSDKGISFHSVLAKPISVVTIFSPKISDFKIPDNVLNFIVLLFFSFEIKSATHLVPFPHAPDFHHQN